MNVIGEKNDKADARRPRDPRIDPFPGDILRQYASTSKTTYLLTVVELKRDPDDRARVVVFDIIVEGDPGGVPHRVEHHIDHWRNMCTEAEYQVLTGYNARPENEPR